MSTEARITHRTPERLRLKIPSRKGDYPYFDSLRRQLSNLPGVKSVEVNPMTGSLLFLLEPGREISLAKAAGNYFTLLEEDPGTLTLQDAVANLFGEINRKIGSFTGGGLDLRSFVFAGCVALGIYQISIGNIVAPAWYVAFWYAMTLATQNSAGKETAPRRS
jgi:copper chaperone CopZ